MIACLLLYGASPKNYYWFGFYNLRHKYRKTFVTHTMSERIQRKCNNPNKTNVFQDKACFFHTFSKYMKRQCRSTTLLSTPKDLLPFGPKIIYKPINGSQGIGVRVFELESNTIDSIYETIRQLPNGVIESFIQQHKEMDRISNSAVNIVRIVTGLVEDRVSILAATAAFAEQLPYTNATGDAIFANLDVNTGIIISDGCNYQERVFQYHPISGQKFKGFQIPYWNELIAMVKAAAKVVPEVRYVGWDIAISDDGPVIVEGNNDPGYEWMQISLINPSGIGKKKTYSILL